MTQLTLETVAMGAEAIIDVKGEIDMATVEQLRELLYRLIDSGTERIVLRCRELAFLDSSGIGAMVAASNRLGKPTDLAIEDAPPHVRKVLDVTGVSAQLTVR